MYAFLDVDGCLARFVEGALKLHGKTLPWPEIRWDFNNHIGVSPADFWRPMAEDFWASLDPTDEFHGIITAAASKFDVKNTFLLTSPCATPGCITGKARWVEKHLPEFSQRLLLTDVKEMAVAPGRVLIDDREENVELWRERGGDAFLFPRPWNSAREKEPAAVEELHKFLRSLRDRVFENSKGFRCLANIEL